MPDIKEVIDMMVADGRPEQEIIALIDRYNKEKSNATEPTVEPTTGTRDYSFGGGFVGEDQDIPKIVEGKGMFAGKTELPSGLGGLVKRTKKTKDFIKDIFNTQDSVKEDDEKVTSRAAEKYFSLDAMPKRKLKPYDGESDFREFENTLDEDLEAYFNSKESLEKGINKYEEYKKWDGGKGELPKHVRFKSDIEVEQKNKKRELTEEYIGINVPEDKHIEAYLALPSTIGDEKEVVIGGKTYKNPKELYNKLKQRDAELGTTKAIKFEGDYLATANEGFNDDYQKYETDLAKYEKDNEVPLKQQALLVEKFKKLGKVDENSSEQEIDEYNALVVENNNLQDQIDQGGADALIETQKSLKTRFDDLTSKANTFKNTSMAATALGLDYSLGGRVSLQLEKTFLAGGAVLGAGAMKLIGQARVKYPTQQDIKIYEALDQNYKNAINYYDEVGKEIETTLPTTIKVEDINSGNVLEAAKQMLGNNAPSILVALGTSGVGALFTKGIVKAGATGAELVAQQQAALAVRRKMANLGMGIFFEMEAGGKLGDIEVGEKYAQENIDALNAMLIRDKKEGIVKTPDEILGIKKQISDNENALSFTGMQKAFSTVMYGGIAAYAERLGTLSYMNGLTKTSKAYGAGLFKQTFRGAKGAVYNVGVELLEETATQLGHNLTDITVLGEDKSMIEGIDADFLVNTAFTSLAIQGPSMGMNSYNALKGEVNTRREREESRVRTQEILQIQNELNNTSPLNFKKRRELTKRKLELLQEAEITDVQVVQKISRMTPKEVTDLFEANRLKRKALKNLQELGTDVDSQSEFNKKQKQRLIEEHDKQENKRELLLGKPDDRNKKDIEAKLKELGFEKGVDYDLNNEAEMAFQLGKYQLNQGVLMSIVGAENVKIFKGEDSKQQLEEYLKQKVKDGVVSQEDADKALVGNKNAMFIGNEFVLMEDVALEGIVNGGGAALFAASSPLHELLHRDLIEAGIVVDGKIVKSAEDVVASIEDHLNSLIKNNLIDKKNAEIIKKRIKQYESKEGVDLEELITLVGDLKDQGVISRETMSLNYDLKRFIKLTAGKLLGDKNAFLGFNTIEDIFRYIDSFQKRAKDQTLVIPPDEKEETKEIKESKGIVLPRAKEFVEMMEEGIMNNRSLVDIVNSPQSKPDDKFAAIEVIVEKNWPVISNALKFNPTADISMESVKQAITEQMQNIFPEVTLPDGTKIKRKTPLLKTYNQKEEVTTFLSATLRPRQAEIFTRAKTIDAKSKGIDISEAKGIEAPVQTTRVETETKKSKINILKFSGLNTVIDKIRKLVKPKKGEKFKEIISKYAGKVGELVFDIPAKKIMKGGANLVPTTKYKKGMPIPSEAQNIQTFFNRDQNTEKFVKVLPLYNVADLDADITEQGENILVSRDTYGVAVGLRGLPLDYFYEDFTDPRAFSEDPKVYEKRITSKSGRSRGLSTQTQVKKLKKEFRNPKPETIEKVKRDIGITPKNEPNIYNRDIGQLQKGFAKVYSINVSLSAAQRDLEAKTKKAKEAKKEKEVQELKQQTADITAAQSKIAFSESASVIFGGIKSILSEEQGKIFDNNLLQLVSTFVGVNELRMSEKQKEQVLLSEDTEAIEIALDQTYGNSFSKQKKSKIANEIKNQVAKLGLKPKTKNIVKQQKIVDQILKSTKAAKIKVAKVTGSDITAKDAQNNPVRQETRRKSDGVYFKRLFNKNKEQAIADLIMLGGHSHTSGKIGKGRGQYYKNTKDFYDTNLGKVGIKPVYKTFKRAGKTVYELNTKATAKLNGLKYSTVINGKKVIIEDIPVTKASQSVAGAIGDHNKALKGDNTKLDARKKHEKHARRVLNEYVAFNVEQYKAGLQDNVDIMLMMTSLLSNMNSVLARAGALNLVQENIKLGRYEHGHPRVAVLIRLVIQHVNKNGVKNIDSFFKSYDVNIIDLDFDDAITDAGYKETLADNQTFDDPSWFRMYNNKTRGDKRLKRLVEAGTKKVPKDIEVFMKANDALRQDIKKSKKLEKAIVQGRKTIKESKGITVLDFDDTLATTKSLVKFTTPDGKTGTLNAEQYASTYEDLLDQGYTFDFSDFNKVVKGKLAPLFNKAIKLQGKFGPENMFVLTARPMEAQKPIFDFLKANGLNIPIKNITGLANSTAEAKALWIADKVGEGYNDFYFADDALQNVQAVKNMLDQFDVKSKVQQAKIKFSESMNQNFNDILENVTGIESKKRFAAIKARKRGESKGKFRVFIPPSHEDFVGLLYNFMGKGRVGDGHRNFLEEALVKPLNRAYREIDAAKQAIANDYKSLNKQFPDVKNKLIKNTPDGDFTFQDAIRVYLWNKHGYTIPGLSMPDQLSLSELVMSDPELQAYAEALNVISKQETYVSPGQAWETGNIRIDLIDATGRVGRDQYLAEFNENAEILFNEENLNKIEAGYGVSFRSALEDIIHRIKTGVNRPKGESAKPNMFMNWLNASVSGVMFFNTRSALLQQMSNVNFLNFADNNIYAAGKAFANQPQYWKDFAMIFNSDMLKQRRGGLQTDINGAELADAIKKARPDSMFDQVAIIVGKALRLGFLPTQIGDNIAIATGGAAFYRNRVNKYIKDGMTVKEAEAAAFTDFQNITQSTQQSARPDMTSQQQASWIGKLVLNFLNTPSQYNRIIKKAGSDIINRRITPPNTTQLQSDMSNMSRILYYGAAQNLIFYSLQTALFAVMFGTDDEDDDKRAEQFLKKKERVINGSIDTILRGSGIYGVAVSTLKNMIIKFLEQRDKGFNKDESAVIMELANFSPVVGIKLRKIVNAEKTLNYNKKVIEEMNTFDIDNPQWSAVTNYVEAITTAPTNRIYQKTLNLRNAADNDYTALQRALFFSGYTTWSLNLGDTQKMKDIKEKVKGKKKSKKKVHKKYR